VNIALICMVNDPFDPPGLPWIGGGQLVFFHLGKMLVSNGMNVTFITRRTSIEKPVYEKIASQVAVYRLTVGPPEILAPEQSGHHIHELILETEKVVLERELSFDIVHSQYWLGGICARRLRDHLEFKHIHNILSLGRKRQARNEKPYPDDALRIQWEIDIFNNSDVIVAQCDTEAADLLSLYPELNHRRITVVNHGADAQFFAPRPETIRDFVCRTSDGFSQRAADTP